MAQMGFMILTCGLGLWAAAVFHLFAHGFYKATLFLSRVGDRPPAPDEGTAAYRSDRAGLRFRPSAAGSFDHPRSRPGADEAR